VRRESEAAGWLDQWNVPGTQVVVLFGGNPQRRDEVVRVLGPALNTTVIGTLSEAEGLSTLERLGEQVKVVLIGGRYDDAQRQRIRAWVARRLPGVHVSEPGVSIPYENGAILRDVAAGLATGAR
jgi:hypothetical protein